MALVQHSRPAEGAISRRNDKSILLSTRRRTKLMILQGSGERTMPTKLTAHFHSRTRVAVMPALPYSCEGGTWETCYGALNVGPSATQFSFIVHLSLCCGTRSLMPQRVPMCFIINVGSNWLRMRINGRTRTMLSFP